MKNTINALKLPITLILILISFIACDKDFNIIESDVLGKENSNFLTDSVYLPISAYNKKLDSLQSNGLASNLLGVFNDPAFGQTVANIVTQVTPTTFDPDFGTKTKIDSVILTLPLFSRAITDSTYTISDSLYGNSPIKLSIYKNDYFLRDFDPYSTLGTPQKYFSKSDGTVLNSSSVINFENQKSDLIIDSTFTTVPSSKRIRLDSFDNAGTLITTYATPALRLKIKDTLFWRNTIINKQGDPVLSNASNFNNYFRGLYFKAEAIDGNGNMILLNLASTRANIIIYYSKDSSVAGERTQSTYQLNFTGNKVNIFTNDYSSVSLQNGNKNLGDEKLYLKGTAGSMAVVNLFKDQSAFDNFINDYRISDGNGGFIKEPTTGNFILKRLINDAFLTIYEDESISTGDAYHKYDRIYAYDIENNQPTIDYQIDPSENTQFPLASKIISLSQRDTLGKYKIRLTEHLNSILLRDSTNTKIGLVLSNNVNYTSNAEILNSGDGVTGIPSAAIISPRGTILHGSNSSNDNKRLKLKIFYTEAKDN